MWTELYLAPFLTAFALTAGLILMFLLTPLFRRAVWRSERRHGYKKTLSRLGGVAMLSAFIFAVFFDPHLVLTREFYGLLFGGVLIFIFGLWDDLSELGWKIQVFFQVALTALIFIFGMRITSLTNPFGGVWIFPYSDFVIPGFGILFVWFFLVMNAMNWLDGVDGLCGGVALITLVTIFFLSLKPEVFQPPINRWFSFFQCVSGAHSGRDGGLDVPGISCCDAGSHRRDKDRHSSIGSVASYRGCLFCYLAASSRASFYFSA